MDNVLVTGGLGYVGSSLVPTLLEEGYHVRVLDNMSYMDQDLARIDRRSIVPSESNFEQNPNYESILADIRNPSKVRMAMSGMDVIVHLAAISGLPACKYLGSEAREVNVGGTANVMQGLQTGQALIYASTGSVYGKLDGICTEESLALNPLSLYARTKAEAEELVGDRGVKFRFATGFGYSDNLRLELLINNYAEAALKTGKIEVYEADARRTFINVSDMARAIIFAMAHIDDMAGKTFNVGHDSLNYTKWDVASAVRDEVMNMTGRKVELNHIKGEDQDKRDYEVCYDRIKEAGFCPEVGIEEGVGILVKKMMRLPGFLKNQRYQ